MVDEEGILYIDMRQPVGIWIALLRGINVSGQKLIKMEDLRKVFESLHYENVSTYIQSGNIVFAAAGSKNGVHQQNIAKKLVAAFGFEVPVVVRSHGQLGEVIKKAPFKPSLLKENEKIHVTFLSEEPSRNGAEKLSNVRDTTDEIHLSGSEIYLLCRNGYGKTQYSNTFVEKKLGVPATTRNWATVNKLWEIGNETRKDR